MSKKTGDPKMVRLLDQQQHLTEEVERRTRRLLQAATRLASSRTALRAATRRVERRQGELDIIASQKAHDRRARQEYVETNPDPALDGPEDF
jgi:hypothetical protein